MNFFFNYIFILQFKGLIFKKKKISFNIFLLNNLIKNKNLFILYILNYILRILFLYYIKKKL